MKRIACLTAAAAATAGGILYMASALAEADGDASPIYGVEIPAGYQTANLGGQSPVANFQYPNFLRGDSVEGRVSAALLHAVLVLMADAFMA